MNISPSGLPAGNYTHATNVTDSEHLQSATTTRYTHIDYLESLFGCLLCS